MVGGILRVFNLSCPQNDQECLLVCVRGDCEDGDSGEGLCLIPHARGVQEY